MMQGSIALVGGDEFRPGCEEMDTRILVHTARAQPRVVVIPTAAVTGPEKAASDGVEHFSRLGADASALMVLDRRDANDEELAARASWASIVYFTGGSPDYLLTTLRKSKLLSVLEEQVNAGAIWAGSSAGAMVIGSMMRQPTSGAWVHGLGIVQNMAVLPHHERSDPDAVARDLDDTAPPGLTVLGIDAKTCCFGRPGEWTVLGLGTVTVYRMGSWTSYSSGESLPSWL